MVFDDFPKQNPIFSRHLKLFLSSDVVVEHPVGASQALAGEKKKNEIKSVGKRDNIIIVIIIIIIIIIILLLLWHGKHGKRNVSRSIAWENSLQVVTEEK